MEPAREPKSSVFVKVVKMGQGGSDVERKEGDGKKKMGPGPDKRKAKCAGMAPSPVQVQVHVQDQQPQSKAKQKHQAPTDLHLIRLYLIHLPTDRLAYLLFLPYLNLALRLALSCLASSINLGCRYGDCYDGWLLLPHRNEVGWSNASSSPVWASRAAAGAGKKQQQQQMQEREKAAAAGPLALFFFSLADEWGCVGGERYRSAAGRGMLLVATHKTDPLCTSVPAPAVITLAPKTGQGPGDLTPHHRLANAAESNRTPPVHLTTRCLLSDRHRTFAAVLVLRSVPSIGSKGLAPNTVKASPTLYSFASAEARENVRA
ncbi:hypothetical protein Landi51_00825 [Colletotrichum acutatum]